MCTAAMQNKEVRRSCVSSSNAEQGGRGVASRLQLERRVYSMLTMMLDGGLDVATRGGVTSYDFTLNFL